MLVILIRHAQAVSVGTDGVTTDFNRHLTGLGQRQAAAVAANIASRNLQLDAVLCSPYRRTSETARVLSPCLKPGAVIVEADEFAAESERFADMVSRLAVTPGEVLVAVGHMPDIADLARLLTGRNLGPFETGQAVCLKFETAIQPGTGQVEWMFIP